MKKKFLILTLLLFVLAIAGCGKQEPSASNAEDIGVESEIDVSKESDLNIVYAAEDTPTEAPTETPVPTEGADGEVTDEPAVEEEPVVLYAKTYKQVYPELYNFYPENPTYKYSQWVFTIDSSSSFIGSITLPDGTVIVGGGSAGDKDDTTIDIPTGDYTGGDKPSGSTSTGGTGNGNGEGDNPGQTGPVFDVVVGDPSTNPKGDDYYLNGDSKEDGVNITTKTVKDAEWDEKTKGKYSYGFYVEDTHYIIESLTTKDAQRALNGGLYDEDGKISEEAVETVQTSKGIYNLYTIELRDGTVLPYAATYTPYYSAGSVYLLKTDDVNTNEDLFTMLQLLVVE